MCKYSDLLHNISIFFAQTSDLELREREEKTNTSGSFSAIVAHFNHDESFRNFQRLKIEKIHAK